MWLGGQSQHARAASQRQPGQATAPSACRDHRRRDQHLRPPLSGLRRRQGVLARGGRRHAVRHRRSGLPGQQWLSVLYGAPQESAGHQLWPQHQPRVDRDSARGQPADCSVHRAGRLASLLRGAGAATAGRHQRCPDFRKHRRHQCRVARLCAHPPLGTPGGSPGAWHRPRD